MYRQFLADPAIQRLAELNRPTDLVGCILDIDRSADRETSDVAAAYAATVALTLQDGRAVFKALEEVEVANLEWVGKILRLWDETRIVTKESVLSYRPRILESSPQSDSSDTETCVDFAGNKE